MAADLVGLMQHYRQRWGSTHFVLVGFSFGADVLPAIYNNLPLAQRDAMAVAQLEASRAAVASFKALGGGWDAAHPTAEASLAAR